MYGVKDIDLFCFDPDTSWEAEDPVIRRAAGLFPAVSPVELRNLARVHLWYEKHFGIPIAPYGTASEAISAFASRLRAGGYLCPEGDAEPAAPEPGHT